MPVPSASLRIRAFAAVLLKQKSIGLVLRALWHWFHAESTLTRHDKTFGQ
jgi:hypothetical protein